MLVVIFGAGASYDSVSYDSLSPGVANADHRPPLADQLFENRFGYALDAFPRCRGIVSRLRFRSDGQSLERELEDIQSEGEHYAERRKQIAAIRFYLQRVIDECSRMWASYAHGVTNYVTLLDEIDHWRHRKGENVCYVTFNYDRLLEQACSTVLGFDIDSIDSYVQHQHYSLVKVHGSVDWTLRVTNVGTRSMTGPPERWMIDSIDRLQFDPEPRLTIPGQSVVPELNQLLFPAIAIPVVRKTEFLCPRSHLDALDEAIRSATRVLVVGWRATEQHFMERWHSLLPTDRSTHMVVSGGIEEARDVMSRIARGGGRVPTGHTFSSLVVGEGLTTLRNWLDS